MVKRVASPVGAAAAEAAPVPTLVPGPDARPWFVYLLLCRGDRLYAGVTPELATRMRKHRSGTGAKFTRSHPPERLLAAKRFDSRAEALSMEHQVKQLSAARKRALAAVWAQEAARIDDVPELLATPYDAPAVACKPT